MKKPFRYWFSYVGTLSWDIISWIIVLVGWILWGTKLHWLEGLWCEFKENSWPRRTWYKRWRGTCLGRGGFYAPGSAGDEGIDTPVEEHEHFHTEQYVVAMWTAFVYANLIAFEGGYSARSLWIGLVVWTLGGALNYILAMFVAWMRGESPYRGNILEEGAYAIGRDFKEKRKND